MQKRIHKLSPLLINQIAAGEVVTRPASVVKELVENAIDAHATQISIYIEQGGLGLIQVVDNGDGIHPDDMLLAVTRHATSKLADVSELAGIDSLGFRGEALASIAAVSHLTLISSQDDSGVGQQLTLSGNEAANATIKPIVKTRGTTVTVRDLYFNIPARRSHLKSISTEFSHIEQVIQRIAISFAHIQLNLYHQNKLRFSLKKQAIDNELSFATTETDSQAALLLSRLEQALALPLSEIAYPFQLSLNNLLPAVPSEGVMPHITGWLFLPSITSTITAAQLPKLIYINQRLVTDFAISQVLQKAARQVNLAGLGYALFFDLPTDWINVNVHPNKQHVRIQPLTNILALLNQAIVASLKNVVTADHMIIDHNSHESKNENIAVANNTQIITAVNESQSLSQTGLKPELKTQTSVVNHIATSAKKPRQVAAPSATYSVDYKKHDTVHTAEDIEFGQPILIGQHHDANIGQLLLVQWQQVFYLVPHTDVMADSDALPILESQEAIQHWLDTAVRRVTLAELFTLLLPSSSTIIN